MTEPVAAARCPRLLEAVDLRKSYRMGRQVLDAVAGISLQVHLGETLCVMGASGAGKSTLLNMLGGLDRPTGGRVIYKGRDIYRLPPRKRNEYRGFRIGFVFQSYHLLEELDVVENVMLPAMSRPGFLGRAADCRTRAVDLLKRVGLGDRIGHRPTELSGGEQQRVALARALVQEPELVLADEPTGNLDSTTGTQVLNTLLELTAQRGHALIMVTHNEAIAQRFSRTLRLRDGRIQEGTEPSGPEGRQAETDNPV